MVLIIVDDSREIPLELMTIEKRITPKAASAAIAYLAIVSDWKERCLRLYFDTAVFDHRKIPAKSPKRPAIGVISPV